MILYPVLNFAQGAMTVYWCFSSLSSLKTPLVWKLDEEQILTWEGGVVEAPLDPESVWA